MTSKIIGFGLLFLSLSVVCCKTKEKPENFDFGHIENGKYINSFFDLKLTLPDDWVVQTKEQKANLQEMGKDLVSGDDKNLRAIIDASEINTANLLVAFQYEVGAAVEYNPNLALIAENLKNTPGIKNGGDYLFQARKFLKKGQIEYTHIDSISEQEVVNGHEFYTMECVIDYMGLQINQKYYSTLINGFSLGVVISYTNDEQKRILENSIESMNFSQ